MVTKFTGQLGVCGMNLGEAEKAEGEMLLTERVGRKEQESEAC